jgi:DNA repair protein RecN (Recombination protein N)
MIKRLSISQYVIISSLTVDFAGALTVLTGETGAGKSILLDAMGLIIGDEADPDSIRQDSEEAEIEAHFEPPQDHPVWKFLAKRKMAIAGPQIQIRRVIGRTGKDEILVNGESVTLPTLKELGTYLVEIHGQFANQNFLAAESQLSLLDAFGAYPVEVRQNVAQAWADIARIAKELEDERTFLLSAEREKNNLERLVTEVEKIGLKEGGYEKLKAEMDRMKESRSICELFNSMHAQLIAQTGVELSLTRINRALGAMKDPALDTLKESIEEALTQTRVAISEMQQLGPKYLSLDTSGIREAEKRLNAIEALAAEQKVSPVEFFEHYENLSRRLIRIKKAPAKMKELSIKLGAVNEAYREYALILSSARKSAAGKLSAAITAEMAPLKLLSAEVMIEVTENMAERTARGINQVSFTARMNPGMPFSPIAKTASGGELARLILAVKMILQQVQSVSTLVFDEIDTGIGGAAAAAVGSRIARLAEKTQILVITHSPQVASCGNQHLHVSKQTDGTSTRTIVTDLSLDQRIHEVSRMLAGEEVTEQSLAAAKTLIEEARQAADARKVHMA